jgi:hypothetical protein
LNCTVGHFCSLGVAKPVPCDAGAFMGSTGGAECEFCPVGQFQPGKGETSCFKCADNITGTSTQLLGARKIENCVCEEGMYMERKDMGNPSDSKCLPCPPGMTCALGSGTFAGTLFPAVKPKFWSSRDEPFSVFECDNEERCPGGASQTCGYLLTGRSCQHCLEGYYWNGDECQTCTDVEMSQLCFQLFQSSS